LENQFFTMVYGWRRHFFLEWTNSPDLWVAKIDRYALLWGNCNF